MDTSHKTSGKLKQQSLYMSIGLWRLAGMILIILAGKSFMTSSLIAQTNAAAIRAMVEKYKADPRGPYQDIRWYCKDGTTREARDPCPTELGNQRARYKPEVIALAENEHIFLGQILATTPDEDFWDVENEHSRLKQYQLERYLRAIDDGWVNRKAQYYRGAMQDEDEQDWGQDFYSWLLSNEDRVRSKFFLIRQSVKDIPHSDEDNNVQRVRALSSKIVDALPSFQDLRVKIHGMPDAGDAKRVADYKAQNKNKISGSLNDDFDQLIQGLEKMFSPFRVSDFEKFTRYLPGKSKAAMAMDTFLNIYPTMDCPPDQCKLISETALILRKEIDGPLTPQGRLAILDISNKLELLLSHEITRWEMDYLSELLAQVRTLIQAATAFGFLELWEWDQIRREFPEPIEGDTITLRDLENYTAAGLKAAEWSTGMVRAHYMPVIELYRDFEPKAVKFYDDRIRSSVLLYLGNAVSRLGNEFSIRAGFSNDVQGVRDPSSMRGLNPGMAFGELVIVNGSADNVEISEDKIYIFHSPPTDLKPVAGIATISEGNLVSHIQLLARNLGIPNAVLTQENMDDLRKLNGEKVLYAVSHKGTVVIKPASRMTKEEKKLFEEKKKIDEKISIPVERIQFHDPSIINMRDIHSGYSGVISGPKAANLGQLKRIFPSHVSEGIVLPFGVFYQHMNQNIPGTDSTYWRTMIRIFDHAECMRCSGYTEAQVETYILEKLAILRQLIREMPLLPSFRTELAQKFETVFGKSLGRIPVFVRSDTNMEDLKDFTGAGLNLTVFNVVEAEKIYQGIKDVWASPYTERSYKWRQRYLANPENVFPSIVIIPSIDGDFSGVMITKGITSGNEEDITVAFNRGVGGAVDGQSAETWLLAADGRNHLLTPAREISYRTIPSSGGSVMRQASFENPILNKENLEALRAMANQIRKELSNAPGVTRNGPWDVELAFKDNKIWLFQVRPFVENKQAATADYLHQITPKIDKEITFIL